MIKEKEEQDKTPLDYTAGQFAFFDIGGVYNDPKGPIRHFTISSSPTENFIMFRLESEIHHTKGDFQL